MAKRENAEMTGKRTQKRAEKKSETLEVRLPHSKKEAFKAACEEEGITASHAVRTFIDAYLKKSRRVKLKRIAEDITMKLFRNPVKTAGIAGTGVIAAIMFTATTSVAEDRDATPIGAPLVTYPAALAEEGIGGECTAILDVSVDGLPENVKADCTHPGFVEVTIQSAKTLRFEPKIKDGKAVPRKGVEYPLVFQISNDEDGKSLEDAFAEFDKNKDGVLTADENISQAWIDEMDTDGNGNASFAEYKSHVWPNVK